MTWYGVLLLILGILLLLWLAAGFGTFLLFCWCKRGKDPTDEATIRKENGPYADAILEGQARIREMKPETVRTTSHDGLTLVGHYIENPHPRGIAILFHGYHGAWNFDFSASIPYYYALGFSILGVDQRGQGESGGRFMTYGLKERYDVLRWVEYVNERFGENTPILIGGLSMGAATVQMACALELPNNVRACVSDCGCSSPEEIGTHVLRMHKVPVWLLWPQTRLFCRLLAGFGTREYSTLRAQRKNRIPTFFVHGEADDFVPTEMTLRSYKACRAEKQLLTIPGAAHGVSYLVDKPRYQAELRAFLDRYF